MLHLLLFIKLLNFTTKKQCVDFMGPRALNEEQMTSVIKILDKYLTEHFTKQEQRHEQRRDEDYDDETEDQLLDEVSQF
jgi:importin-5